MSGETSLEQRIKNYFLEGSRETKEKVDKLFELEGPYNKAAEHRADLKGLVDFNASGNLIGGEYSATIDKVDGLVERLKDMRESMEQMPDGRAKELRQKQVTRLEKEVQREAKTLTRAYRDVTGVIAKENEAIYADVAEFQELLSDQLSEAKEHLRTEKAKEIEGKKALLTETDEAKKITPDQLEKELEKIEKDYARQGKRVTDNFNALKEDVIKHRDTLIHNNGEVTESLEAVAKKVQEATGVDIKAGAQKVSGKAAGEAAEAVEGFFRHDKTKGFGETITKEGKQIGNLRGGRAAIAGAVTALGAAWLLGAFKSKEPNFDQGMARGA